MSGITRRAGSEWKNPSLATRGCLHPLPKRSLEPGEMRECLWDGGMPPGPPSLTLIAGWAAAILPTLSPSFCSNL